MITDQAISLAIVFGTDADVARTSRDLRCFHGDQCPACDAHTIEGSECAYRCVECGHQWEPSDIEVAIPEAR